MPETNPIDPQDQPVPTEPNAVNQTEIMSIFFVLLLLSAGSVWGWNKLSSSSD